MTSVIVLKKPQYRLAQPGNGVLFLADMNRKSIFFEISAVMGPMAAINGTG
jgi:hypothetical protein